ncbi:MAG: hypothetical protein M3015_14055 [Bacteroidota bacterium]|nr:hypothetical protein [Bacteroidota bacterium]
MAKIVSIGKFTKQKPLTSLMIKTLKAAMEMQLNDQPFGQRELDGSFMSLVERSLIDVKTILLKGRKEVSWYVTRKGINALHRLEQKPLA